ncbi:histidine--tRNA ligase, partial [Spirochaetota bacterium]
GGRNLTLRPEGTASVVRAYVENGDYNRLSRCKLFYIGPMFRAEKPQKGRLRQFNQLGAELFGSSDPFYDFEIISMMDSITKANGIEDYEIIINSIGCRGCRDTFIKELKKYYEGNKELLCDDCKKRLDKNTLRLLDCKVESCKGLKKNAPAITEHICEECSTHYRKLKGYLDGGNVKYKEDPHLVRGLDYYTKTTFEFTTNKLGAQNAFAGGGRYDYLVEKFGGKPTPAVGFSAGIERMLLLIDDKSVDPSKLDIFLIHSGGDTLNKAVSILPVIKSLGLSSDIDPEGSGFKSQFKKANRENARICLIFGEDELASNSCTAKFMDSGEQENVKLDWIEGFLKGLK